MAFSAPKMSWVEGGHGWAKEVIRMPLWRFKSCPRCLGDIFIDRDMDGWYEQCLQCSYRRELKSLIKQLDVASGS